MSYNPVIYQLLTTALAGKPIVDKIYPVMVAQNVDFPAIRYGKSIIPTDSKLTAAKVDTCVIDIMIMSENLDECDALADQVRAGIDSLDRAVIKEIKVRNVIFESQDFEIYDSEEQLYGISVKYKMIINR